MYSWNRVLLEKLIVNELVKKCDTFLNVIIIFGRKKKPVTVPCPDVFSPIPTFVFKIHFDVIQPSLPGSSMFFFPAGFTTEFPCVFLVSPYACHMFRPSRPVIDSNRIDNIS